MSEKNPLGEYLAKRDLERSPEPGGGSGRESSENGPIFVIQEHDASSHHFDLRLEIDGVLKSWAVPKGPSTDPREQRLAVPTEDHPLAYAEFEGVVPEGEYGAGTVLVWDAGTFRNLGEDDDGREIPATRGLEEGHLKLWLLGEKIHGGYALTRLERGENERWLLVKMKDDEADARRNPVSTEPESVLTGRTLDEIREEEESGEDEA